MQTTNSNYEGFANTVTPLQNILSPQHLLDRLQWRFFGALLVLTDISLAFLAFLLAYTFRFLLSIPVFQLEVEPLPGFYNRLALIFGGVLILLFWATGLYNRDNLLGGTKEYALIFNTTTLGLLLVITFSFLTPEFVLARGWLLAAWFFTFFLTSIGRFLLRRMVYYYRRHGYFLSPAVIVGANKEGLELARQLQQWKTSGFRLVGFVDDVLTSGEHVIDQLNCLGGVAALEQIIQQYQVQEIIVASSSKSSYNNLVDIFKKFGVREDLKVRFSSGLYEIIATGVTIKDVSYVPLMEINPVRLTGIDRIMKLALDYVLVIPGLILISPLLLLIVLVIKLDSPGPVIYRRRVMGVRGKQFDAYKFRTMVTNGDELLNQYPELKAELSENHKLKNDPRITRSGKFLRKFSLDELPQLFNVLKGEMSLVGPRMISPVELEKYEQWDVNLLTVRPGITGLWQISGRSDVTYDERVQMDMHYIRNWSIWLDLQILIQTFPSVIKGRGAY